MQPKRIKIGIFDSGVGGITVLAELRRQLHSVDYVYLGDTAHVPYGPKSPAQIEKLSLECVQKLKKKEIDALVIACNTSCAWAFAAIEKLMAPIPVYGVVSPGVEAALAALQPLPVGSPILILATRATVVSGVYGKILKKILADESIPIVEQACPLLVPMIEEGWVDHPILKQTILEYVGPYRDQYPPGVALLGCTHYPWIHRAFEEALPEWKVVNSAQAIAGCLQASDLFQGLADGRETSTIEWIFTDPEAIPSFVRNQWIPQ